jgi:predicted transcriptional regulator
MGDGDAPDLYSLRELSELVGASEDVIKKALKTMDNVGMETMYYYET